MIVAVTVTADLHNLPEESLGQVPKFFLRSAKHGKKRRELMKNAEIFLRHTFSWGFPNENAEIFLRHRNGLSGTERR